MDQAKTLTGLQTPAIVIDERKMNRNIRRMQTHLDALGVAFRPHVKTAKSIDIAMRQRLAGARGITVSTLKEARAFFAAGFTDILYAVALAPGKIDDALELLGEGCALQLAVDSADAADELVRAASRRGVRPQALIEIDVDGHRGGVGPGSRALIDIGRVLDGGDALLGVMAHAGSSYDCVGAEALERMAEQERARSVEASSRLREAGFRSPVVSVGSTPTALSARSLAGVTEVRAGVYVFFDLVMAGTGVCTVDEIAMSVLCTVIGHQTDRGWALVDAGWMAMSRDRGTQSQAVDQGYGVVCDIDGRPLPLRFIAANQEHGILAMSDGASGADIVDVVPRGARLRILPNHACATGAQHDAYHMLDGDAVVERLPRFNGW